MAIGAQSFSLPFRLSAEVEDAIQHWEQENRVERLWRRDASLWTGSSEAAWLGWLDLDRQSLADLRFDEFRRDVLRSGATDLVLMGMGGSSLCPEVLATTFGRRPPHPALRVLDSTDPAAIASLEAGIDLRRTLFIVSSKSGTTLETRILMLYFYDRVRSELDASEAGRRFIAITDPGSELEVWARDHGFRAILSGRPDIGGRFSALSAFGMAPAAAMGVDVARLLAGASEMVEACRPPAPAASNPGVVLGIVLGVLAGRGRDKLTFIASPPISSFVAWLEQLLAESTGKGGKGLIPIEGEPSLPASSYGPDRAFVYLRLESAPDPDQDRWTAELEAAGLPVVRIEIADFYALGQEFFRWEVATASAGALMKLNPFDQPDVESSKDETRRLTGEYERTGALPEERPLRETGGAAVFASPRAAGELSRLEADAALPDCIRAYLACLRDGDYFALLAYVPRDPENVARLQTIRSHVLASGKKVATTVGFGPRFLHSTGQVHKGGPDAGVFLEITCEDPADLPVPGKPYSFGVVKTAQARGDFSVLSRLDRRILRIHFRAGARKGLEMLERSFKG